jgi:hypothetical protein
MTEQRLTRRAACMALSTSASLANIIRRHGLAGKRKL